MSIVLVLAGILIMLGTLAGPLLIFPTMRRGFSDQWRRFPQHRRRRGLVGGALAAAWIIIASTVAIVGPWGPYSILYVFAFGGGGLMLLALIGVAVQVLQDTRRVKQARAAARSRLANE